MRKAHLLKTNKSTSFPSCYHFFDTETNPIKQTETYTELDLKLLYSIYIRVRDKETAKVKSQVDKGSFYDKKDFTQYVDNLPIAKKPLYIFSANIWFDLRVSDLLVNLLDMGWIITKVFANDKTFIMNMVKCRGCKYHIRKVCDRELKRKPKRCLYKIKFLNIQNFFPFSVKQIGKLVGIKKEDIDFEKCSDQELLDYCKIDTDIIYKAMFHWIDFIKKHDLGYFSPTLASQAFNAFRHRFMNHKIFIHDNKEAIAIERKSYFGGRTECFKLGKLIRSHYYYLDVNSMYPFVMKYNDYPVKFLGISHHPSREQLAFWLRSKAVIANVLVYTRDPLYPLRMGQKVIFPTGKFQTALCSQSLINAINRKHLIEVYTAVIYEKAPIFEKYVNFFYALKIRYQKGKGSANYEVIKLFLNTLYGKFGQMIDDMEYSGQADSYEFLREDMIDGETGERLIHFIIGNREMILRRKAAEGINSFPAISSHVTDYARCQLWKYIEKAGRDNVFYCDTDSLIVNKDGFKRIEHLLSDTKIGKLRLDKEAIDLEIRGCKDYSFGSEHKLKGIRFNAKQIGANEYEQDLFPSITGDTRNGMTKHYRIHRVKKVLKRIYDKGKVSPDGKVTPYEM